MPCKQPLTIAPCLLSGLFIALAALFVARPEEAAIVYGLRARDPAALFYVRAIGLRDLAPAVYILGLTLARQWRALSVVMTGTLVNPIGDMLLLAWSKAGQPVHYLLHGLSLLSFAGLAFWVRRARLKL